LGRRQNLGLGRNLGLGQNLGHLRTLGFAKMTTNDIHNLSTHEKCIYLEGCSAIETFIYAGCLLTMTQGCL